MPIEVNIQEALAIPLGGTGIPELTWLATEAQGCERILELGSYHGRSTLAMLANSHAHIWCVDSWAGPTRKGVISGDADYLIFLRNLSSCRSRVHPMWMRTAEAYALLTDLFSFDMIFIDADHSYEAVQFDIANCIPLVHPGGLLCGHDFISNQDVTRAVREILPFAQIALPRRAYRNIWYYRSRRR